MKPPHRLELLWGTHTTPEFVGKQTTDCQVGKLVAQFLFPFHEDGTIERRVRNVNVTGHRLLQQGGWPTRRSCAALPALFTYVQ
jgi:hypothetical protein